MGLGINLWVLFFVWLAGALDAPDEIINNQPLYSIEDNQVFIHSQYAFYFIRNLTMGATLASMVAYLSAQFIDVQIFHYLILTPPHSQTEFSLTYKYPISLEYQFQSDDASY